MRIESGDDAGPALAARPGQRLADHGLMAEVEAVEIAQREDRAAQGIGDGLAVIEADHGAGGASRLSVMKA